ncbi:uncharacterized protein K02A2.6-like, partial [Scyliorhinus canicula]|uniref:uncharacterized protein K02A2.6-like n=1 Tax=Scyliorhinus canicula TaxID=7830 RepID=UPI0018F62DD6
WGMRVIVPEKGQELILRDLHNGHPGVTKIKMLARSYVWWPGLNTDIEKVAQNCSICQEHQKLPPAAPLHHWEWPGRPWARLHADFAGPFQGSMFLLLIDAKSKWLEVHQMGGTTSCATIEKMCLSFSTHGLPEVLVTDNGTQFTSEEFARFMKMNGIRHIRTAPYHPASNGLAERAVQTFKRGLKKQSSRSMDTRLAWFLFSYRTTPHAVTGVAPTELLMGRRLRTRLSMVFP